VVMLVPWKIGKQVSEVGRNSRLPQPAGSTGRVSSADVAREAGVSRATVSYVLNRVASERISDETRDRVLEAARRLGHVPHAPARALRLGRSNLVLALVGDFTFGYVRDYMLELLDVEMSRRGYALVVHRYSEEIRPLTDLWSVLSPDVVVLMGGMPASVQTSIPQAMSKFVQVQPLLNQHRAGEMQVEYLARKGHKRLAYAYPTNSTVRMVADERLAGSRSACERLGLDQPTLELVDRRVGATVSQALDRILESGATAVCAHNDEIAIMLSLDVSRRGLRLGQDLAVIGIDNTPTSSLGITTIGIDVQAATERIVSRVVAVMEDVPVVDEESNVLCLIERESA
jgi:DNA-binding LacI/PurR family transcriptional regulator